MRPKIMRYRMIQLHFVGIYYPILYVYVYLQSILNISLSSSQKIQSIIKSLNSCELVKNLSRIWPA